MPAVHGNKSMTAAPMRIGKYSAVFLLSIPIPLRAFVRRFF
jgi:hypothetical protein